MHTFEIKLNCNQENNSVNSLNEIAGSVGMTQFFKYVPVTEIAGAFLFRD